MRVLANLVPWYGPSSWLVGFCCPQMAEKELGAGLGEQAL